VREENRPRRDDRGGKGGGRSRDRGRGRDGKQHDRRPPGGKFHDHVASLEPTEIQAAPAEVPVPVAPTREPEAAHKPKNRPKHREPREEPRHEKRGSQRQHNEQAARPEAVNKSDLPAFLFRPVPVRKPVPQAD